MPAEPIPADEPLVPEAPDVPEPAPAAEASVDAIDDGDGTSELAPEATSAVELGASNGVPAGQGAPPREEREPAGTRGRVQ
jgi:hypothetical protein